MVLSMPGGLFKQDDVRETAVSDLVSGERVPIGGIIAWLKTFTGTPGLPAGYVECAGQVLNDGESVYDGETIPDLNGGEFLRGSTTSGGTGGSSTHTITIDEMPSHKHNLLMQASLSMQGTNTGNIYISGGWSSQYIDNTGGGAAHENKPPYYNIVWIMRIK